MSYFPVTDTFFIDPISDAAYIEAVGEGFLIPYPVGIYLNASVTPCMTPGNDYYQEIKTPSQNLGFVNVTRKPVLTLEDITDDVFNVHGDRVIVYSQKRHLGLRPSVPIIGLKMIQIMIEATIDDNAAWQKRATPTTDEIIIQFLKPEFHYKHRIQELLRDILSHVRHIVFGFIRHDPWIMFFVKSRGTDIFIEKSIDFRIHDWTQRKKNGEWK